MARAQQLASFFGALGMVGHAGAGQAQESGGTVLQPSSRWVLDYAETHCRLVRVFGEGRDQVTLVLEQYKPSDEVSLTLVGEPLERFGRRDEVDMRFGPLHSEGRSTPFKTGTFGPPRSTALIFGGVDFDPAAPDPAAPGEDEAAAMPEVEDRLPQLQPATGAQIEWLTIGSGRRAVRLQVGAMGDVFTALNQCSTDLLRHWGLDADRHRTLTRMAHPENFPEVARAIQRFYPDAALRAGEQARLEVRMIIEADGSISDCSIAEATSAEYIESPACREFSRRARFAPALDAEGQPMKSYYSTGVVYEMGR